MTWDRLHIQAQVEHLAEAVTFVESAAAQCGLSPKKQFAATLAMEEAFVNICNHAYPQQGGTAEVGCGMEEGVFVLEISDGGVPFDLLSLPPPELGADVMERKIGGLGVHFIRTLADRVSYRRHEERNILRICFELP